MKLAPQKRALGGFTLTELTLVVSVILGLITILFLGVSAYKKGSNRAMCILNISSVQKAVRSYQNLYQLENGDELELETLAGTGKLIETLPICPSGGNYDDSLSEVPGLGIAYLRCSLGDSGHAPKSTEGW